MWGIEGCIQFALLSYAIYLLSGPRKQKLTAPLYVVIGTASYFGVTLLGNLLLPASYLTILDIHMLPYWFFFLTCIALQLLLSGIFLAGHFLFKALYTFFFMAFIMLYKVVCTPLYEVESQISPSLYRVLDFGLILLGLTFLTLLIVLFKRFPIQTSVRLAPRSITFVLYFPISILAANIATSNSRHLHQYADVIIAFLLLTYLPLIYYFFWVILQSFEEQRRLDLALTQTTAQLSRFRFSIELQEQLRKERHELKNNYFYIQTLLLEGKYDALNHYMEDVIGEKLANLNQIETGNTLMDYLLNRKIAEARKYNIKTYAEVIVPKQLDLSEDVLCTILLNLLDNAIEASRTLDAPDIHINISCAQNYLVCKIKNRANDSLLHANPHLHTTKKDSQNHGLGLKIIRRSVNQANGIFQIDHADGYFTATVMLPMGKV